MLSAQAEPQGKPRLLVQERQWFHLLPSPLPSSCCTSSDASLDFQPPRRGCVPLARLSLSTRFGEEVWGSCWGCALPQHVLPVPSSDRKVLVAQHPEQDRSVAEQIHLVLLVSPEKQESRWTGLGTARSSLHAFSSTLQSWEPAAKSLLASARENTASLLLLVL